MCKASSIFQLKVPFRYKNLFVPRSKMQRLLYIRLVSYVDSCRIAPTGILFGSMRLLFMRHFTGRAAPPKKHIDNFA